MRTYFLVVYKELCVDNRGCFVHFEVFSLDVWYLTVFDQVSSVLFARRWFALLLQSSFQCSHSVRVRSHQPTTAALGGVPCYRAEVPTNTTTAVLLVYNQLCDPRYAACKPQQSSVRH